MAFLALRRSLFSFRCLDGFIFRTIILESSSFGCIFLILIATTWIFWSMRRFCLSISWVCCILVFSTICCIIIWRCGLSRLGICRFLFFTTVRVRIWRILIFTLRFVFCRIRRIRSRRGLNVRFRSSCSRSVIFSRFFFSRRSGGRCF